MVSCHLLGKGQDSQLERIENIQQYEVSIKWIDGTTYISVLNFTLLRHLPNSIIS